MVLLILIAVSGSAIVAVSSPLVFPAEETMMMADPAFDTAAFYRSHFPGRASRDGGHGYWPGEQFPMRPKPVAGLSQSQTDYAYIIVEVGKQMGLARRAFVVAIATALQESHLRNLANPEVPQSLKYPHDGADTNYDSLGLFQQRPSMGWGTVAQLMDPAQSAARFYARLMRVSGWSALSISGAAQAVQRSAFPTAYAKHVDLAERIVEALP
jgi:hypothetical protein